MILPGFSNFIGFSSKQSTLDTSLLELCNNSINLASAVRVSVTELHNGKDMLSVCDDISGSGIILSKAQSIPFAVNSEVLVTAKDFNIPMIPASMKTWQFPGLRPRFAMVAIRFSCPLKKESTPFKHRANMSASTEIRQILLNSDLDNIMYIQLIENLVRQRIPISSLFKK